MAKEFNYYAASVNPNGDLIVVLDNVVCQRVSKDVHGKKVGDWFADLVAALENTTNPRTEEPFGSFDADELEKAVKSALK